MKRFYLIIALILFFAVEAHAASKDTPHLLGNYGVWRAYKTGIASEPVCYMTLTAHFPPNKKYRRTDALLTITHRPYESSKDVFSYTAGYNYKPMSSVDLHIGKNIYSLFTSQDTAWSRDAATDHHIAAALQNNASLSITGTMAKPATTLTDKFGLKGAAEAYQAIGKACGLEAPAKPQKRKR